MPIIAIKAVRRSDPHRECARQRVGCEVRASNFGAAIDTIYVQDEKGCKLTDKEQLDELSKGVSKAALSDTVA